MEKRYHLVYVKITSFSNRVVVEIGPKQGLHSGSHGLLLLISMFVLIVLSIDLQSGLFELSILQLFLNYS